MRSVAPPAENAAQGGNMNIVSEEARGEREQWLSSGDIRTVLADQQSRRHTREAQAWNMRAERRWVGISVCVLSAAVTLASAALIVTRL